MAERIVVINPNCTGPVTAAIDAALQPWRMAGGPVRGGKVYGRWPGLAPEVLYEGRDLNLTTDFRTVCSEVISRHLGQKDLSKIFPGFRSAPAPLGLIA